MTFRRVEVLWNDASTKGGWDTVSEYARHSPAQCSSMGYILKRTKKELILVMTKTLDNKDCMQGIAIPAKWIRKVRTLK